MIPSLLDLDADGPPTLATEDPHLIMPHAPSSEFEDLRQQLFADTKLVLEKFVLHCSSSFLPGVIVFLPSCVALPCCLHFCVLWICCFHLVLTPWFLHSLIDASCTVL